MINYSSVFYADMYEYKVGACAVVTLNSRTLTPADYEKYFDGYCVDYDQICSLAQNDKPFPLYFLNRQTTDALCPLIFHTFSEGNVRPSAWMFFKGKSKSDLAAADAFDFYPGEEVQLEYDIFTIRVMISILGIPLGNKVFWPCRFETFNKDSRLGFFRKLYPQLLSPMNPVIIRDRLLTITAGIMDSSKVNGKDSSYTIQFWINGQELKPIQHSCRKYRIRGGLWYDVSFPCAYIRHGIDRVTGIKEAAAIDLAHIANNKLMPRFTFSTYFVTSLMMSQKEPRLFIGIDPFDASNNEDVIPLLQNVV